MCAESSSQRKPIRIPSWFDDLTYLDAELGWSIVREAVLIQILDDLSIVIPRLNDQQFYQMNSVILKKDKNIRQMVLVQKSKFQPAGRILSLVSEITADCLENINIMKKDSAWHMPNFSKTYKAKVGETKKRIELRISEICKYNSTNFVHGTLRLNEKILTEMLKTSKAPKTICVVQTSFIAEKVKILVKINNQMKYFEYKNIAIAFDMVRYDLLKDGTLQNPTPYWKPKFNKIEYWQSAWFVNWPEVFPEPTIFDLDILPCLPNKDSDTVAQPVKVDEQIEKPKAEEQIKEPEEDQTEEPESEGGDHIEMHL